MKENFKAKVFLNKSGKGRVKYSEDEFLTLSSREMFKVFPGDEVVCQKMPGSKAKIKEVLKRNTSELTGIIKKYKGKTFLTSLDKSFHLDILLEGKNLKNFKSNDICEVRITSQPSLKYKPKAKPIKTLKSNDVFEEAFIFATNGTELSTEWSKSIINECNKIKRDISAQDIDSRKDLRSLNFVTIDGSNAKDFDDAVFCEANKDGFVLQVAIADVAEIVEPSSSIDKEALSRGTSIYFPKRVIPMLPEEISNNLCSLIPNEDRNVLVCKMNFTQEGEINSYDFSESIINSHKRFTYNEVEFLKQNKDTNLSAEILNSINALEKLTKQLLHNRSKRYALEIESSEPTLSFGNEGNISEIFIPKRLFAHQMIEEAMISANICAAKFIKKHLGFGVYRIHEEPEHLKLENLKKFFSLKGLSTKSFSSPLEMINSFIKHVNKDEKNKIMNVLILQSLKRACYSTKEIGHFGLQLKEYSHFTSPIRRYPDLISHRLIKNVLNKKQLDSNQDDLEMTLNDLSDLEQRAERSSRQVIQRLICHHLEGSIGEEFSSIVVGITEFGLFCEIENHFISGLVHVSDLSRDRYIFDKEANILKGKRTGRTFRIGQKINVQLANVIPEERKIVLVPK